MSLACDATSPSPWAQSASKVEPPLLRGWGPLRTSVKGPATSHVGPHLRARQLCVAGGKHTPATFLSYIRGLVSALASVGCLGLATLHPWAFGCSACGQEG